MGPRSTIVVALVAALALAAGCSGAGTPQGEPASAVVGAQLDGDGLVAGLPPLPEGDVERSSAGVERSAVALAEALGEPRLPGDDGRAGAPCPADRLRVLWSEPGPEYEHGALAHPVGPEPAASTTLVNGAVVCDGATTSYMGFTARWALERWIVLDVPAPDLAEDHGEEAEGWPDPADLPRVEPGDVDLTPLWTRRWPSEIEDYAPYIPQRVCDPRPKPAVVAFTELVLGAYPGTASWGVSRACGLGGVSEHKEGRAWDWRVDAYEPAEREQAEAVASWLMATDEHGNRHAMARRLGVMYVIWNGHIWSSTLHEAGWRPYGGASPHTDHVHISFSPWGAVGQTSFWQGVPLEGRGLLAPFEGIASAFPPGFAAPPPRPPGEGHGSGEPEARDSWSRPDGRTPSTTTPGGGSHDDEAASGGGAGDGGSEDGGSGDGGEQPGSSPLPQVPVEPPLEDPALPIPHQPLPSPSPSPSDALDLVDPVEDLLDEGLEDGDEDLLDGGSTLP